MVNACPREEDPRVNIENFIKDPGIRSISGLREEGMGGLVRVITDEINKQCHMDNNITLNRDVLSGICFQREMTSYLETVLDKNRMNNILISEELSMAGWQHSFMPLIENGFKIQVFFTSLACRQVPICSKMF